MVDKDRGQYTPEYLVHIFDFSVSAVRILVLTKNSIVGNENFHIS